MFNLLLTGLQISINFTLLDMAAIFVVAFVSGGLMPHPTPEACWILAAVFIVLLVLLNVVFGGVRVLTRAR